MKRIVLLLVIIFISSVTIFAEFGNRHSIGFGVGWECAPFFYRSDGGLNNGIDIYLNYSCKARQNFSIGFDLSWNYWKSRYYHHEDAMLLPYAFRSLFSSFFNLNLYMILGDKDKGFAVGLYLPTPGIWIDTGGLDLSLKAGIGFIYKNFQIKPFVVWTPTGWGPIIGASIGYAFTIR